MKKIYLILITLFSLQMAFGQTTIWSEDFESYANNSGIDGTGNIGDYPTNITKWTLDVSGGTLSGSSDYLKTTHSFNSQVLTARDVDGDVYWISEDIDISGYTNVSLSADFRETGTQESTDYYRIEYKLDGGAWTTFATNGYQNDDYGGWDTASQTGLNGSTVKLRITFNNNAGSEYHNVDNIKVEGTPATNDQDSEAADVTQPAAATIGSLVDTSNEAVDVFKMEIYDWGTADGLPTKVTNIRIKPHTTNTADWTDNIQGFVIDDGSNYITPASTTITDTYVDFAFNPGDLNVADGTTTILTFAVYLNTSNIQDGAVLSFMVDADDHGFTADSSGSDFAATFSGGDFNSNDFTIGVEATQMQFQQQPTDVAALDIMTPAVTVAYTDANGNIDIDVDGLGATATLSATGATLDSSTTTDGTPVQGIMTFNDIKFTTAGTGVTLTVTDNGVLTSNTTVTSDTFEVTGAPEMSVEGNNTEIADGDTTPDTADYTDFGDVDVDSGSMVHTFTIKNTGNIDLNLTDPSPYITITGDTGDFTLTHQPSTPISANGNTTFEITFDPTTEGVRTAHISIANDDSDENPYNFDIKGTGFEKPDWANLQYPNGGTNVAGDSFIYYAQVYEPGITDASGQGANINAWIGYSTTDNDPTDPANAADWTWISADYNTDSGNNDEYKADLGTVLTTPGTYYVASRFQIGSGPMVYGGYNGGFWDHTYADGTGNHSVQFVVNPATVDWCNIQSPANGSQNLGGSFNIYAQVYVDGRTNPAGQGAGISAWIGISQTDASSTSDFTTSDWTWYPMTYNTDSGNNDEYMIDIMPHIYAAGTYYYVSRFQLNSGDYYYGGYNGGFWDGSTNVSGVLTVNNNDCEQLIISEYGEGPQSNYIEIYNPTGTSKDLSHYQIWRAYDDSNNNWNNADKINLSGTIAPGETYTLAWKLVNVPMANVEDTHLNYNGDDAIGLAYNGGDSNNPYLLIDAFGNETVDTGGWDVAGVTDAGLNHSIKRKASVKQPNPTWTPGTDAASSEWEVLALTQDYLTYHTSDCVVTPEIEVRGNANIIYSGDTSPSTDDLTDFGQVLLTDTKAQTFTIYNVGNADLGSISVSISGADASEFSVSTAPAGTITAGSSSDFVITFTPASTGVKHATISIANDDTTDAKNIDESPTTFDITAEAVEYYHCINKNYVQDFETTPATPELQITTQTTHFDDSSSLTANSLYPQNEDYFAGGSNALYIHGDFAGTLEFASVDTRDYNDVTFSVRLAAFSGTSGNGMDTGDKVTFLISTDDGATYSKEIIVKGNNNAKWSFNTGTGVAKVYYDGNDTATEFAPSGGGYRTTDGYSTIMITDLPSVEKLRIKIWTSENHDNEYWILDDVKLTMYKATKWDGTTWSNGAPTETLKAVINGDYDATTAIHTCECQVKSGKTLTVKSGNYLLVEQDIHNDGTILVENEGALVQNNPAGVIDGNGTFQMNKTSLPLNNYYEYVYWSSPLNSTTFTMGDVVSDAWRYYKFDPTANPDWVQLDAANVFDKGMGYAISAPNGTSSATTINAQFVKGSDPFNNGDVTVNIYKRGGTDNRDDYNLIGNPYPSAIDFNALAADNTAINGSYQLWTNCAGLNGNSHQVSGYTTYVASGTSTAACSGSGATAGQYIASGQGFFVEGASDNSTLTFKNKYRVTGNNTGFLNRPATNNNDIVWLDLTNSTGAFNQIAIGFYDFATDNFDRLFDAHAVDNGNGQNFYSLMNNEKLNIQGLSPLDNNDRVIPLGVNQSNAETLTFHINRTQGELDTRYIYLHDIYNNTYHDLKSGDYVTTIQAGETNDRFELLITNSALGIDKNQLDQNAILFGQNQGIYNIKSLIDANIKNIYVYDVTGKLIFSQTNINAKQFTVNLKNTAKGMLLFNIILDNGKYMVKKAIHN